MLLKMLYLWKISVRKIMCKKMVVIALVWPFWQRHPRQGRREMPAMSQGLGATHSDILQKPILYAGYSDLILVRWASYYMTASSF